MRCLERYGSPDHDRDIPINRLASLEPLGCDSAGNLFMTDIDKLVEINSLHESMYVESLVFLALKTRPGFEAELAETRERIIRIYARIQALS